MLKKGITYCFIAWTVAMVLAACSGNNALPPLEETYSRTDKNPFGAYVAFRQLNELFYRNDVRIKKEPVEKSLSDNYSDTAALYVCISEHYYLRRTERSALLEFIEKGNSAFVSARYFDTGLLKEMNLAIAEDPLSSDWPSPVSMKQTAVQLATPPYSNSLPYSYYYMPLKSAFRLKSTGENIKVLGVNESGNPDFLLVFYGKGRLYIHCEPRVFSNYFLLKGNNHKYLQQAFSFVPRVPDNVLWDDYYRKRSVTPGENEDNNPDDDKSSLSVLLKYPSMAWAFWLTLLALLLYLVFGSKRRQRIIKPVAANENTSVAFTETVGRLYLQKKDNRNIADKMITYLLEHIRNQYFISTNQVNAAFTSTVSRKSNLPAEQVEKLFHTIDTVQKAAIVDDALLLSLNEQIENFYKHKS